MMDKEQKLKYDCVGLAQQVFELRTKLKLTQEEMAETTGLDIEFISCLENADPSAYPSIDFYDAGKFCIKTLQSLVLSRKKDIEIAELKKENSKCRRVIVQQVNYIEQLQTMTITSPETIKAKRTIKND